MNIAIIFGRKNSKGLPNKNIKKILGKPACSYPIDAAIRSKKIDKIFISSDSNKINKIGKDKGCEILHRPKSLASDQALLSDAIFFSVNQIREKCKNVKNVIILLCNSICVNNQIIDTAISKLDKGNLETVVTISKLNMFSPIRAMKINRDKLDNFFPNNTMKRYTSLSGDRNKSTDTFFITHSCTASKINVFDNKKNNPMPFVWMGKKKSFIIQDNCVGDIDFEWQQKVAETWLKKN